MIKSVVLLVVLLLIVLNLVVLNLVVLNLVVLLQSITDHLQPLLKLGFKTPVYWSIVFPVNSEVFLRRDPVIAVVAVLIAFAVLQVGCARVVAIAKVLWNRDDSSFHNVTSSFGNGDGGRIRFAARRRL